MSIINQIKQSPLYKELIRILPKWEKDIIELQDTSVCNKCGVEKINCEAKQDCIYMKEE